MKKLLLTALLSMIFCSFLNAQESGPIKTALLVIDVQEFYFPGNGKPGLVNAEGASLKAKEVLQAFREKKQLVIHIRHKVDKGFEINKNVEPLLDEKIITKEEINSFQGTDLLDYLKKNKINRLIIVGMQTHMCVEAATRAGKDFGFECIVIEDACATRDLKVGDKVVKAEDVHNATLATITYAYGKVINVESFLGNQDQYLFQK